MDELGDEGAVAGDDAALGAALLMADLEGAIAAAGDEIASLRRVTDAVPRPGLPGRLDAGAAAPEAADAELARTQPTTAGVAPVVPAEVPAQAVSEPLSRDPAEPAAAGVSPERTSPVGAPAVALAQVAPTRTAPRGLATAEAQVAGASDALSESAATTPAAIGLAASAPVPQSSERLPTSYDAAYEAASTATLCEGPTTGSAAPMWPATPASAPRERGLEHQPIADQTASPLELVAVSPSAPVRLPGASAPDATAVATSPDMASAGGRDDEATSPDAGRSGPTEGDVYLDGERVGRWMARHLARELGGPQAAGTGFDPRLGPAWPGSMHGN